MNRMTANPVRRMPQATVAQGMEEDIALERAREEDVEMFDTPGMEGSMQQVLANNLGLYAVCEFVVGTQNMQTKQGLLYSVGRGFVVLYDENNQTFQLCDVFSIKFITLYLPGQRPWNTGASSIPMVTIPGVGTVPAGRYGLGTGNAPNLSSLM